MNRHTDGPPSAAGPMLGMTRLQFVAGAMLATCGLCLVAQCVIERSYDNLASTVMVTLCLGVLCLYLWRSRPFDDAPVSSLAILGFAVSSMWASLVAQSLAGHALVAQLRDPLLTFPVLCMVLLTALGTHWVYRNFKPFLAWRDGWARHVLSPMGIHDIPRPLLLWPIGLLGLTSMAVGGASSGNVAGKALQAMEFMAWAPFLIVMFHRVHGARYCSLRAQVPGLLLYALLIVGIAVGRNARQLMFIGPVTAVLIYLIAVLRETSPMPRKSLVKVLAALLMGILAIHSLADLATAMAVARDKREGASAKEMITETWHTLFDQQRLAAYRDKNQLDSVLRSYDEAYLSNPLLARLSETKFHDNMLYFGNRMDVSQRSDILEELGMKMVVMLPQPVLDALGLHIKKYQYAYSMGDVYASTSLGLERGSFLTGTIWADVYLLTGPFFPFAAMVLFLVVFVALDSLTRFDGAHFISPIALGMAWPIFLYGLGGESLAIKFGFLMRDLPQRVVLYAVVLFLLKFFLRGGIYRPGAQPGPGGSLA